MTTDVSNAAVHDWIYNRSPTEGELQADRRALQRRFWSVGRLLLPKEGVAGQTSCLKGSNE